MHRGMPCRSYVDPEWKLPEENLKEQWMDVYRKALADKKPLAQQAQV